MKSCHFLRLILILEMVFSSIHLIYQYFVKRKKESPKFLNLSGVRARLLPGEGGHIHQRFGEAARDGTSFAHWDGLCHLQVGERLEASV